MARHSRGRVRQTRWLYQSVSWLEPWLGQHVGAATDTLNRLLRAPMATTMTIAAIAIALALRWFGLAPADDVLATSPGALSAVIAVAVDRGSAPAEVALFHLVRLLMVLGTLPLVVLLLPRPG